MPIAAVPAYLGTDFSSASPGLRFGMYLPIWTNRADQEHEVNSRASKKSREAFEVQDMLQAQGMNATIATLRQRERNPLPDLWDKNDFAARHAWEKVLRLTANDKATMRALAARQSHTAQSTPHTLTLDAIATAPFTTGLGNEHPLENGFAFLNPYGLPYLPGSGVKGVLRQAARELTSGDWGDPQGWDAGTIHLLERRGHATIQLSIIDVLFGRETPDGDGDHVRGALSFWDALPQIPGDTLAVDIMTPHQSHYYQKRQDRKSGDSTSPHDSGAPNPISFLTLPPGTGFAFHVVCDQAHLERLAPDLAHDLRWQTLLTAAFEHAFEWLGFGAKTAVGYGAMQVNERARQQRAQAQAEAAKAQHMASLSPAQQLIEAFVAELRTKHEQFPSYKEKPNAAFHNQARALAKAAHEGTDWSADEKRQAAEAIETWLPKLVQVDIRDERKKLKLSALKGL
ncbi:MAG: type III-B CRISPR module RAMP protein Cmr6 [Acidovorax sp.]|jgi:CRISPR-associated protein Cmr6|nr:type III-B CRISPR module RAMP protein Cmr6 [Giesbergeria sp.]MBP7439577.1 type III-B CRISPR module RAMP protein Cmr6 [Acidovorax sp.]